MLGNTDTSFGNLEASDRGQQKSPSPSPWPRACTLAELGRILAMMHGPQAPSESSLKKWSATGVFADCLADINPAGSSTESPSFTQDSLRRPKRAGRPGLRLITELAIQRAHDQWPHLAQADTHAIVELAVARTADRLQSAVARLATSTEAAPAPSAPLPPTEPLLLKIEAQLASLHDEMVGIKRELAQFAALRNNLITRLDEAVARAQEALSARSSGTGPDPLVEARRDRDMGVLKSMMGEMLAALERIDGQDRSRQ